VIFGETKFDFPYLCVINHLLDLSKEQDVARAFFNILQGKDQANFDAEFAWSTSTKRSMLMC